VERSPANHPPQPVGISRKALAAKIALVAALLLTAAVALRGGPRYYNLKIRGNLRAVVPGVVYRSAQPTAAQLADWKARYGITTVINLRGVDNTDYAEEQRATTALGLKELVIDWPQNRLMNAGDVHALQQLIKQAPGPYLIHCGNGVNRSGAVAMLLAMWIGDSDYLSASSELRSAYWGLPDADRWATGRFAEYEDYRSWYGLDTDGWAEFLRWLESTDTGHGRTQVGEPGELQPSSKDSPPPHS
jgi:predicted protein tyrosine phosphatase